RAGRVNVNGRCRAFGDGARNGDLLLAGDRLLLAGGHRFLEVTVDGVVPRAVHRARRPAVDGAGGAAADGAGRAAGNRFLVPGGNGDLLAAIDRFRQLGLDVDRAVRVDVQRVVDDDGRRPVVVDGRRLVVLDRRRHVVLAVDVDLLLPGRVVHRQLVEAAPLVGLRFHPADDGAGGESEWGLALGVVDAAGDDRLVRIALEEVDDHLLPHTRRRDTAPALPCPWLRDADTARAVLVVRPEAIPVELHLDAAELVGVDLIAGRPDDHRRLRTLDEWFRCRAPRPELLPGGQGHEAALVARP